LRRGYDHARARWPDVALSPEAFAAHVERLGLLDGAHVDVRGDDVFLAAAVLDEVPRALARMNELLDQAAAVVARVDARPAFIEDVKQELRVSLFAGADPKLRTYSASGALVDWLRVVAMRAAIRLKRYDRLHPTEDLPQAVLGDQEALQLKGRYLEDFRGALETGFGRLSPRDRTLLRLHFVDGLNIDRIGSIYGVHRATVARWLLALRGRLFDEVKGSLAAEHGLDTAEVRSLYRLMEREVHITISRILQE
jgi:RNA polymerase sigma-70 factor (ECF subfamily)